jgi:LAGLIDADG endonuclease
MLFNSIKKTLACGNIIKRSTRNIIVLSVSKFEDTYCKMIPLFNEYGIKGIKALDFQDFVLAAEIIKKKDHLTLEGLEEIRKIRSNMNRSRVQLY